MYTPEKLKLLFPKTFDPAKNYLIELPLQAKAKVSAGTHLHIGTIDDLSENPEGVMVLLEVLPSKPPTNPSRPKTILRKANPKPETSNA